MVSSLYALTGTLSLRDSTDVITQLDDTVTGYYTIPDISVNEGYALFESETLLNGYAWTADIYTHIINDVLNTVAYLEWNDTTTVVNIDYAIIRDANGNITDFTATDADGDSIIGGLISTGPFAGFNLAFDLSVSTANPQTDSIIVTDDQFVVVDNPNLMYEFLPSVSLQGDLQEAYSEDLYQINLETNTVVVLDVDFLAGDTLADSVIYLLDSEMNIIASNDDEIWGDSSSYLEYTVTQSGIYYAKVDAYVGFDTGTYTLNISQATQADLVVITDDQFVVVDNSNLQYGYMPSVSLQGDLQEAYSEDLYQINLEMNTVVVLDVDFLTGDTLSDSVIYLLDSEMNIIDSNDDENWGDSSSYLEYTVTQSGVYYAKVASFEDDSGTYTLNISNGSFEITPNHTPTANDDTANVLTGKTITIDVLANDTDSTGNGLLSVETASATNGTVMINADSTIDYTPNVNFIGTDIITYTMSDIPQGDVSHSLVFTNAEIFGNNYNDIWACIDAAIMQWEQFLTTYYPVNIEISITGIADNFLASASANDVFDTGVHDQVSDNHIEISGVQYEIATGIDINGPSVVDGGINISTTYLDEFWFDPTPYDFTDNSPGVNQYDFRGIMMHEFAHILGFNGNQAYEPDAQTQGQLINYSPGFSSIYDTYIAWDEDLNSFIFTGENTLLAYHELGFSGNLPIYSEGYASGSDLYHYGLYTDNYSDFLNDPRNYYLMSYSASKGQIDVINEIDLGIITDLGYNDYNNTSTASVVVQVDIDPDSNDVLISINDEYYLNNLSLYYMQDGVDTGVSTLIEEGGIKIDNSVSFNAVTLSNDNIYSDNLNILDLYGVLGNIGQTIDTYAEHASDMDNDGVINILDLYDVLDGIGKAPQTFDLVDTNGNLVTSLDANSTSVANWTIIANGDVNASGMFADIYTIASDMV